MGQTLRIVVISGKTSGVASPVALSAPLTTQLDHGTYQTLRSQTSGSFGTGSGAGIDGGISSGIAARLDAHIGSRIGARIDARIDGTFDTRSEARSGAGIDGGIGDT